MGIEIERKFLVKSNEWNQHITKSKSIKQGYITDTSDYVTRVRLEDDEIGTITIKSKNSGLSRTEIEYVIDKSLAIDLLKHTAYRYIDKVRHMVIYQMQVFEVDEFLGQNTGLIVAEIELKSEHQSIDKPDWIGQEVTHEIKYYNDNLSKQPYNTWEE